MSPIFEKSKEVVRTLLPVVILVLVISLTLISVGWTLIVRFLIGSLLLLIGLSVFLWGIDLAMNPIGSHMSREVATSKSPVKIALLTFFLGFLITVAEPDLLILGSQVDAASGGSLRAPVIVYMVSAGVGLLVCLGIFWLLWDRPLNQFMALAYGVFFILSFFISEEFLAISFDASGATTGALTTPFVLALSLGLSTVKGGKRAEENAFGLVGVMSAGPMLALMLLSILSGQKNIQGAPVSPVSAQGIVAPILQAIPGIFLESLLALVPISLLFFVFNARRFKLRKDELQDIIRGLVASLVGLTLFLTAVHSGFMDMGRLIGLELAKINPWLLIIVGCLLGLIVVLVEPAVHVLGQQIEEVTGGHIPIRIIRITLSIGVGLAVALSMVRILVPSVKLWFFLLPGFALAILLSFFADPVFVGIAYDAGGVASGPMTATFVLAFAQGAATSIESANVLVDGFGVIAMVAMAPVFSLMVLGTLYRHKRVELADQKASQPLTQASQAANQLHHHCLMVTVNRGHADRVISLARKAGAKGATILHGRGSDQDHKILLPILQIELQPEKETVWLITADPVTAAVANQLQKDDQLVSEGSLSVLVSPAAAMTQTLISD